MCTTLNMATMPPSPCTYGQTSQSTPKEESKTKTISSKNLGSTIFMSRGTLQDQMDEAIIQWVYREELEPSPPLIEYFQVVYSHASKLA